MIKPSSYPLVVKLLVICLAPFGASSLSAQDPLIGLNRQGADRARWNCCGRCARLCHQPEYLASSHGGRPARSPSVRRFA